MKKINKRILGVLVLSFMIGLSGITVFANNTEPIDLGSANNFVILTKTGISTTGTSSVVGDIGVSPVAATYITGFALDLPAAGSYATSSIVTGKVYAPGYADPTPVKMTTAISDMETAYTDGASRTASVTELGAGNIGGLTLAPGVYKWGTGVTIPTDVTLSGSSNDVWIFQIAQTLDLASATKINLSGGAKANNVYWIVAGQTTVGTTAVFNGNILGKTAIVFNTGAILNGRALSQTAVTLDSNAVTIVNSVVKNDDETPTVPAIPGNSDSDSDTPTIPAVPTTKSDNQTENESKEIEEGCSVGNLFNTANGKLCVNNSEEKINVIEEGCSVGNLFNTANGKACTNNVVATTNYNLGESNLVMWSRGDHVKKLQEFLNKKLNRDLVLDGILGPKTTDSIKKWQVENGLVADGLVGDKTKAKMNIAE